MKTTVLVAATVYGYAFTTATIATISTASTSLARAVSFACLELACSTRAIRRPPSLRREIRLSVENRGEKLGYFSIDIAQCRPFYVVGLANRPGSYPYLPGYTVLHAVSVAGGLYRAPLASIVELDA